MATRALARREGPSYPEGLVIIESPWGGNVARNREYLKACLRDSLGRGEYPFASHRMYAAALDDTVPEQRRMGIRAGLAWGTKAVATIVYMDLGLSHGMKAGIIAAQNQHHPVVPRWLGEHWNRKPTRKG